ncbi:leader peptidase (prepilin peptidase)/N-methyltransferase [Paucibacter oligotrophus]|uniref:Prepilin leader peptidase/N-methyltransferase n=1 Tax=Roseateles oligotrophus TaxID=1769250 RepID=A0A840LDQ3_9BURK|nr:A24 family peptidase [Roseateles oligotrophus]MBB4844793.1 leader peptidase (prepilin peptidase)/N-methyltransferase [Roseateles oligotrophus]
MSSAEFEFLLSPYVLGLLGLCVGSFLNVVVHRLPLMMERQWLQDAAQTLGDAEALGRVAQLPMTEADKLAQSASKLGEQLEKLPALGIAMPRSRCPHCAHALAWHENLPLLGWLRLGGKCSACKAPIAKRYPLIELATGLMFAALSWHFGPQPTTLLWCGFAAALLALAAIDWDTTLLPDAINQPLLWAGLAAALLGLTIPLTASLTGALVGYLSLWSIYWLFKLLTGKEGMGYGDFKLLAALGAWLGWQMILPIVLGASLIGAIVGIAMKMNAQLREGRYVPFGPFLAGGGFVVLFAGPERVLGWLGWA